MGRGGQKGFVCHAGRVTSYTRRPHAAHVPGGLRGSSPLVEKPSRYLGNERGAVRKDLGTTRACASRSVPRGLRDRAVPRRAADPLRHPEPPPDVAAERVYAPWPDMEALLRAREPAARLAREPPRAARLPRRRHEPPVRAHLHEPPDDARAGPHPVRAARAARSIRSSSRAGRAPSTPSRSRPSSTASSSATARRRSATSATRYSRGTAATARRSSRARRRPGFYVPSLFTPRLRPTGPSPRSCRRPPRARASRSACSRTFDACRRRRTRRAEPRRRARPGQRRGDARLREGLPLLPGGLRLPPAARARSRAAREQTTDLLRRTGYEEVSLLSLSTGDYSGVNPL
jgi:hypothetical protein